MNIIIHAYFFLEIDIKEWEASINDDSLFTIDKLGDDLDKLAQLSLEYLSRVEVKLEELATIKQLIRENIDAYLEQNTNRGCMKRTYRSFSKNANVHSQAMCKNDSLFPSEFYYGGAILTDSAGIIRLENILTNAYHCYQDFKEILIPFSHGQVLTFCVTEKKPEKQVYFAGGYSNIVDNLVTKKKECPKYFYARRLGDTENFICESFQDIPQVFLNAIPFGGIFLNSNYELGATIVKMKDCPSDLDKEILFHTDNENHDTIYICTQLRARYLTEIRKFPLSNRLEQGSSASKLKFSFFVGIFSILTFLKFKYF
jgi:hypothetical protein